MHHFNLFCKKFNLFSFSVFISVLYTEQQKHLREYKCILKNCSKKTQCNISEYFHSVCIVPDIAISETIISMKILSKK